MSDTLRDQLLGLGFTSKPAPSKSDRSPRPQHQRASPAAGNRQHAGHDAKKPPQVGKTAPRRPPHDDASRRPGDRRPSAPVHAEQAKPSPRQPPRSRDDIDLAKAYAIRAQREKDERIAAERDKQEAARQRREAKAKLAVLLQGKALNAPEADIARHFDYGGKIKRVHVTADQLKALNSGELGVVQLDGRYVLVTAAVLVEAEAVFAQAVALRVDADAQRVEEPYADPQFQVPDDLVW